MQKIFYFFSILMATNTFATDIKIGAVKNIESKVLGESREYWISLPPSYQFNSDKVYPVIYFNDANLNRLFHAFTGIAHQMSSDISPQIPEVILVGIVSQQRVRDSAPTHSLIHWGGTKSQVLAETGGADDYLDFVQNELIPVIEKEYRTANFKIFAGYSFTGLTVIHSLFNTPNFFDAYIAIDPSLWWDEQIMLKRLAEFVKADVDNKQLFVTTSHRLPSLFPQENYVIEFINKLNQRPNPGLSFHSSIFGAEQNHHTMQIPSFYLALKSIFSGYMIDDAMRFKPAENLKRHFENVSKKLGVELKPREDLVQFFGLNRLYDNQFPTDSKAGIEFLKLNVSYYPKSFSAWFSLAEAYEYTKQNKRALAAYQQAQLISPSHESVSKRIQRIKYAL